MNWRTSIVLSFSFYHQSFPARKEENDENRLESSIRIIKLISLCASLYRVNEGNAAARIRLLPSAMKS